MPKCPYPGCSFDCRTKSRHRARYAVMRRRFTTKQAARNKVAPVFSSKINYEVLAKLGLHEEEDTYTRV